MKEGVLKVTSSVKIFDEQGIAKKLQNNVSTTVRTKPFLPTNFYKDKNLRASFKRYLESHNRSNLDSPITQVKTQMARLSSLIRKNALCLTLALFASVLHCMCATASTSSSAASSTDDGPVATPLSIGDETSSSSTRCEVGKEAPKSSPRAVAFAASRHQTQQLLPPPAPQRHQP